MTTPPLDVPLSGPASVSGCRPRIGPTIVEPSGWDIHLLTICSVLLPPVSHTPRRGAMPPTTEPPRRHCAVQWIVGSIHGVLGSETTADRPNNQAPAPNKFHGRT